MYRYNAKEWQDELGLDVYDFHARNYMPDIGRTTTQDPLADNFANQSPYSFFNNNPIYFIDPTGMASTDWYDDGNGNLKYNPNLTKENASTVLKGNESYVGKTPSVADDSGSYQLNADGSFTNTGTGKNYSGGQSVTLDSGLSITSHTSKGRAVLNFVTDNIASPVAEGVQVVAYIFKGVLYDIPKEAIKEGRADHLRVEGELNIYGLENGRFIKNTYSSDEPMNFEQKKEVFVKPGLSALTSGLSITGNTLVDAVLGGEVLNYFIDNVKQK